ncbi:hypothetical protein [Flavobacterium sp. LHD-85]|uniref:hypothetical protein n=1 Tax=Flavobacterium sp. LHD-85 TaxID=3071410 RepID=UPI0027DFA972|nr:hypothetical protein [Flavobacterium sp. LHD-85]MDQ6527682.1 hypothetical protein [Flavobacterium sp. LHD-85]
MKRIVLIFFTIIIGSCSNHNEKFQINIPVNVINKSIVIKKDVLEELNLKKSFETKSAVYFLENLKYQKHDIGPREETYSGLINEFYKNQDSLYLRINGIKDKFPKDIESYDINLVSKQNIINNIELTNKTFLESNWKNKISLDIYCQYLLPYKVNNEPFTTDWKNNFRNEFIKENGSFIFRENLISAATKVHKWLFTKKSRFRLYSNEIGLNIPDLSVDTLDKLMFGSCHEISAVGVGYMRALGIPAAIDFAPTYLNINAGHEWSSVVVDSIKCIPFDITTKEMNIIKKDFYFFSKVYRKTYTPSKDSHFAQRGTCSFLPEFFNNPFIRDVTNSYTKTSNIKIPVVNDVKSKYCYICVFNRRTLSWSPVGWGKIENRDAFFSNVGNGGVYLAVIAEESGVIPINSPFILNKEGEMTFLKPEISNIRSVKLVRKINSNQFKEDQKDRMIKGVFQGSNYSDFRQPVDLYTIKKNPGDYFNNIQLPHKKNQAFRYVRYYSPKNSFGNVGEIEFYELGVASPIRGKVIGTEGSFFDNPKCTKEAAFDGNLLTYFDSNLPDHSWVGLDLNSKKDISKIRFISRNDMNCVQVGNIYELFYWNEGWKSLGRKTAKTTFLIYTNVPKKSLLWLRNLTEGNEERIFTYENGKQVWW